MALGYAVGSIASIPLESSEGVPCKVAILDGANLQTTHVINTRASTDGSLFVQTMPLSEGIQFGVKLEFCPIAVFTGIVAAVNAALGSQSSIPVDLQDDFQTINVNAVPDGNSWLKYETQRTNPHHIKNVEMRFVTA